MRGPEEVGRTAGIRAVVEEEVEVEVEDGSGVVELGVVIDGEVVVEEEVEVEDGSGVMELGVMLDGEVLVGGSREGPPVTVAITEAVAVKVEVLIMGAVEEEAAALEVEGDEVGDRVTTGSIVVVTVEFATQPTPLHV